jgi:hypothetical protein
MERNGTYAQRLVGRHLYGGGGGAVGGEPSAKSTRWLEAGALVTVFACLPGSFVCWSVRLVCATPY